MLNKTAQNLLLSKLRNPHLRATTDAFDVEVAKAITGAPPKEGLADAVLLFVDIAGFSAKVAQLQPEQVRAFLKEFYAHAIQIIDNHHGIIDRIIGDGIVAVFTPFLSASLNDTTANQHALQAAEEIVAKFSHTDRNSKAALSSGKVLFCKTGLEGVYTDYTVLGNPLTHVYRMEEVASANQIITPENSMIGRLMVQPRTLTTPATLVVPSWSVTKDSTKLRGAETLGTLLLQTYTSRVIRRG